MAGRPRDILLRLTGDSTKAQEALEDLTREVKDADGQTAEIRAQIKTDAARVELDRLNARLDRLRQQEVTPDVQIATARVVRQIEGVEERLRRLDGETAEVKVKVDDQTGGDGSGDGGGDGGGGIIALGSVKAGAATAGLAAGAAFTGGLSNALDQESAASLLKAQLDLTQGESERAGKIAGNLYKNAYGESFADINETIRSIVGNLDVSVFGGNLEGFAAKTLNLTKPFEVEANDVTTAINSIIQNGLAKNVNEAFDVITSGFNKNADRGGEFLDTFNEYATTLKTLGLSASDFLSISNQGFDTGLFSVDKIADSFKELTLQVNSGGPNISGALHDIGLSYKDTKEAFAQGGPEARKTFQKIVDGLNGVEDQAKRKNLAITLFGSPLEDLNVKALKAFKPIKDNIKDVQGAADRLDKNLGSTNAATVEKFKRQVEQGFTDAAAAVINFGKDATPTIKKVGNVVVDTFKFANPVTEFRFLKRVATSVFNAIKDAARSAARFLRRQFNSAKDGISDAFDAVKRIARDRLDDVESIIRGVRGKLRAAGRSIGNGFKAGFSAAFGGIKAVAGAAINGAIDAVNLGIRAINVVIGPKNLNPLGVGPKIKTPGAHIDEIKPVKFAKGGLVAGSGYADTVAALLTPGEFVLNRQAVQSLGAGNLGALNAGRAPRVGRQEVHNHITVPGGGPPDPRALGRALGRELARTG